MLFLCHRSLSWERTWLVRIWPQNRKRKNVKPFVSFAHGPVSTRKDGTCLAWVEFNFRIRQTKVFLLDPLTGSVACLTDEGVRIKICSSRWKLFFVSLIACELPNMCTEVDNKANHASLRCLMCDCRNNCTAIRRVLNHSKLMTRWKKCFPLSWHHSLTLPPIVLSENGRKRWAHKVLNIRGWVNKQNVSTERASKKKHGTIPSIDNIGICFPPVDLCIDRRKREISHALCAVLVLSLAYENSSEVLVCRKQHQQSLIYLSSYNKDELRVGWPSGNSFRSETSTETIRN